MLRSEAYVFIVKEVKSTCILLNLYLCVCVQVTSDQAPEEEPAAFSDDELPSDTADDPFFKQNLDSDKETEKKPKGGECFLFTFYSILCNVLIIHQMFVTSVNWEVLVSFKNTVFNVTYRYCVLLVS